MDIIFVVIYRGYFSNEEDCILNAQRLLAKGFKNEIPFRFESRRKMMEEFDWEYVKNNKIAMDGCNGLCRIYLKTNCTDKLIVL